MKRLGLVFAAAALSVGIACWFSASRADEARPPRNVEEGEPKTDKVPEVRPLAKFLRGKLKSSSMILEGLCTEDFDLIVKGADKLKSMSEAEKWRVSNDALYRQHSNEFRRAVESVTKAAKKKSIDGAALAWTKTTLSCIECHQWVRAMLVSEAD